MRDTLEWCAVQPNTYPQRRTRSHSWRRRRCPSCISTLPFDGCWRQAAWLLGACRDSRLGSSTSCRIWAGPGGLFTLPRWLLKNCAHGRRANEHAISRFTFEVSLSLNCAIVLACGLSQFDADPIPHSEAGRADESDGALSTIGQSDDRAGRDLAARHGERKGREPAMSIRRWPRTLVDKWKMREVGALRSPLHATPIFLRPQASMSESAASKLNLVGFFYVQE